MNKDNNCNNYYEFARKLDSYTGIDKLVLAGFQIIDYDTNIIMKHPNAKIRSHDNQITVTVKKDKYFDLLKMTIKNKDECKTSYVLLELSVQNSNGTNLYSKTYSEYDDYLQCLIGYLAEEYGITLDSSESYVVSIELNRNAILQNPYKTYYRVFELFFDFLPKQYTTTHLFYKKSKKNSEAITYCNQSSNKKVIFYNKSNQLEETSKGIEGIPPNILRVEFRLKRKMVKTVFGTNKWRMLNDSIIDKAFCNLFSKRFEKPYRSWESKIKRMLLKIDENKKSIDKFLKISMNEECEFGIPKILDLEQVIWILDGSNKNHYRTKKEIYREQSLIRKNIFLNRDTAKAEEIITDMTTRLV